MTYWEEPECPSCKKKNVIKHQYSYKREKITEYLHLNDDASVVVCTLNIPNSVMMHFFNDDSFANPFDKEKSRRQKYWKRKQLPPRVNRKDATVVAIKADVQCGGEVAESTNIVPSVTHDCKFPAVTNITDQAAASPADDAAHHTNLTDLEVQRSASTIITTPADRSLIKTTSRNFVAKGEDPSSASPSGAKSINDWANFWRHDIGVNVIPANTKKKETYESWKKWQDDPIPQESHDEWIASGAQDRSISDWDRS